MRTSLFHPLSERRQPRSHRHSRAAGPVAPTARQPDAAVQRAREAGGPLDHAFYSCQCGYLFEAAVTTSVSCPHCGAGQAW